MSRGLIFAEPSQIEGVNFPKEVLLGVLQDSINLKAALEAVHAAVQTESKIQKASALAAITAALKKNPDLGLDDLTPIAVKVFKCPTSKQQRMLQILGDLHKPRRFGAILGQLRQLFEVRPQNERVTNVPASCYRDESLGNSTVATTAAADATGLPNDGRATLLTTPAPKHEDLIRWICINLTRTRTQRGLRIVYANQGSSFCRDAWLCAELEKRFDRVRDGKAEWNELEEIGFSFTDQAKNAILKYLREGSSNAFQKEENADEICDFNPELWKSAAREWAVEKASALANELYSKFDKVHGQVLLSRETGLPTLILKWKYSDRIEPKYCLASVARTCVNGTVQQMIDSWSELYRRHLTGGARNELIHEDCDYKAIQKSVRENIGIDLSDSEYNKSFKDELRSDWVPSSPPHEFEYNVDTDRLIKFAEDCIQRFLGLGGAKHAPSELDKGTAVPNPSCCNIPSAAAADSTGPPDDGRWTLLQPTFAPKHETLIDWICTNLTGTKTLGRLFCSSGSRSGFGMSHCREAWLCAELEKRFDRVRDGKAGWNEFEEIGFSFTDQAKNVILKYLKEGSSNTFQGWMNADKFCDYNPELWKWAAYEWAVKEARVLSNKLAGEVDGVNVFLTETDPPTLRVKLTYLPSNEPKDLSLTTFLRKYFVHYVNVRIHHQVRHYWLSLAGLGGQKVQRFDHFRKSVRVISGIVIPKSGVCSRASRDDLGVSVASSSRQDTFFKCQVDKDRLIELADDFLMCRFGFEVAKPASTRLDKDTAISNPSHCDAPSAAAESLGVPDDKCLTNERGPNHPEITKLWVEYVCENMDTVCATRNDPMKSNPLLEDAHTREALGRHCHDAWWRGEMEKGFERIRDKDAAGWEFLEEIGLEFDSNTRNMIRNTLRRDSETVEVDMNMCTRWRYNEAARRLAARNWAKNEASEFAKQICDKIGRISVEVDSPGDRREPRFPKENTISKDSRHCGKLLNLLEKYSKAHLSELKITRELMVKDVEYVIRELFGAESPDSK